jgi:hypothetical protein
MLVGGIGGGGEGKVPLPPREVGWATVAMAWDMEGD